MLLRKNKIKTKELKKRKNSKIIKNRIFYLFDFFYHDGLILNLLTGKCRFFDVKFLIHSYFI